MAIVLRAFRQVVLEVLFVMPKYLQKSPHLREHFPFSETAAQCLAPHPDTTPHSA